MKIDPKSEKLLKEIGQKIRRLRIEKGWTLEETEKHGFQSWRHLQKVEGGKNITLVTLFNICRTLKISPSELLKDI